MARSTRLSDRFRLALSACAVAWFSSSAFAADEAARIAGVSGDVSVQRAESNEQIVAAVDTQVFGGDILITGADGQATLLLNDESLVRINNNTRLVLKSVDQSAGWLPVSARDAVQSLYELVQGELWFRNKNPDTDLEIETPHVAIAVRGTEFVVRVTPDELTEVDMLEGRIRAFNEYGSVDAVSGEQVYAVPGQAPMKRLLLNPEDAVQWTIVLPDLLSPAATAAGTTAELPAAAWEDLGNGRPGAARNAFAAITETEADNVFAWQGLALASLATNDADAALGAINTATALEPDNADSRIVESYVWQSRFEFDAAITAIEKALETDPDNLTALVKAAQLQFGAGNIRAARAYADRAMQVDASNADALNLTGFLELAAGESRSAGQRFASAIEQDSAFADPWLGLGLVRMRNGDQEAALEAMTTAVALEPTRSVYMSYWGRILYELGRREQALEVLERSAELDPLDPTPWYLQAVVLRDLNRFDEAIEHYNQAVKLNDNRAVYRSRYLLDQDQALRNVDLSLLFQEYDFNAWADRKAVDAINDDFSNYGAHIMYAGALQEQENRDTAFLSETLQSRILQPGNINSFNSFNQYTSFLEKPAIEGTGSFAAGNYDQRVYDAQLYGAFPDQNVAWQAGYFDLSDDGWNGIFGDDLQDVSALVKWDASLQDTILLTFSDTDVTQLGDLEGRFEYDFEANPTEVNDGDLQRFELGYRHNFRAGVDLLAYLAYVDLEVSRSFSRVQNTREFDDFLGGTLNRTFANTQAQTNDLDSWQAQLQLNWRSGDHEVIIGTSNYFGDNNVDRFERILFTAFIEEELLDPDTADNITVDDRPLGVQRDDDRRYHNAYVQNTWKVNNWLDLEGGLYYEYAKNSEPLVGDDWTIDEWNPRLGAVIRAGEHDTFRLAAFKYLSPFFSGQISPTEVAGLTVYRNAREASSTKNAEAAWERDWRTGFFTLGGFWFESETEYRIVDDVGFFDPDKFDRIDKDEWDARRVGIEAEYNQLLAYRLGFVGRYLYADVEDEAFERGDRDEHRIEAGLRYIGPQGLSIGGRHGFRSYNFDGRSGGDTCNFTDFNIEYLLPNRYVRLKFEINNIFDNNFNWITDDLTLGGVVPERNILGTVEINF